MALPATFEPRSKRVLAPTLRSLAKLASTSAPEPLAWISVLPVVVLRRTLRSVTSPGPTYTRIPPPVLALPSSSAEASRLAPAVAPSEDGPATALLPSDETTSWPAETVVVPS